MNNSITQSMKRRPFTLFLFAILALSFACSENPGSNGANEDLDLEATSSNALETLMDIKQAVLELDHRRLDNLVGTIDLNLPLPDGSTLLAWAVESQDLTNVDTLLKYGAKTDLDLAGINHFSPLILACQYGQVDILERLLDEGANPNTQTEESISAFALCAGSTSRRVLDRMISMGAEINAPNQSGQTPLMHAAAAGRVENMQLLLDKGANINAETNQGFNALFFAIKSRISSPAELAINAGAPITHRSQDGTSAIQLAMYQHNHGFAYWLLEQAETSGYIDLETHDRNGHQVLHKAVLANQSELVQLILAKGGNPNTVSTLTSLTWRYEPNFKIADYSPPLLSPLFMAAENGHTDIMKILADNGANPTAIDASGNTIVIAAAKSGEPSALAFALQLFPKADVENDQGFTALDFIQNHASESVRTELLSVVVSR